jgi:hypothetical protein
LPELPKSKVRIRRVRKTAVLEPLADDPVTWLAELKKVPADPEFMKERHQPKTPKHTISK